MKDKRKVRRFYQAVVINIFLISTFIGATFSLVMGMETAAGFIWTTALFCIPGALLSVVIGVFLWGLGAFDKS